MWRHPWKNLEHWWLRRHAPQLTLQLRQRNVYTLPTTAGLMFTVLLLVLLAASVNYQLSLGYGLTFLLMGSGLVSMLMTERQLAGLHLSMQQAPAGYCGGSVAVLIELHETAGRMHRSVGLRFETHAQETWVDVFPNTTLSVALHVPAPRRGIHILPTLRIESRYPYGLLRAWSIWRPATPIIVWPHPEQPTPPWPMRITPSSPRTTPRPADDTREQDMDTDDLRPYRHGDAPRKLAWKATARSLAQGGLPLSREAPPPSQSDHHAQPMLFDWADTADLHDPEARLQRLCAWIEHAHPSAYGLTLPGQPTLNPAEGAEHHRRCLDALARMP